MSRSNGRLSGRPTGRWWGVLAAYVGHGMQRVSPPASCVWLVLFRNSRDGEVTISREKIANITGLSGRYVGRKLRELESAGMLRVEVRGRKNSGPSRYRLLTISTGQGSPLETGSTGHPRPLDPNSQQEPRVLYLQERRDAAHDAGASRSQEKTKDIEPRPLNLRPAAAGVRP